MRGPRSFARPVRVRVHERGDRRLDGILRIAEEAAAERPLAEVLGSLCKSIAEIARVDVASIYVAEGDGLVMRGNRGFPDGVIGQVRLRPGEGLTGFVAECLRPVSVAVAANDTRYKHVPGIGEENFPAFLGIPLVSGGRAAGVLVLQRRLAREFSPVEVALSAALGAPIAYALERAERRLAEPAGDLPRLARLAGHAVAPGTAFGRVGLLPSWSLAEGAPADKPGQAVALAFASLARELAQIARRLEGALDGAERAQLRSLTVILDDDRVRDLMVTACSARGIGAGLKEVAREYARAPYRVRSHDADAESWLAGRAAEVEDLCLLVGARAAGKRTPESGDVLVVERLGALSALTAAARKCVAVVGASALPPLAASLCRAARLPAVDEVTALFAWARPGDRMLVEGDAGVVCVNPPATSVARFRAGR